MKNKIKNFDTFRNVVKDIEMSDSKTNKIKGGSICSQGCLRFCHNRPEAASGIVDYPIVQP
jgi:hypothetical protein